ncbi:MAG TPA: hypothetical protein VFI42_17485 [Thermomicrobiaceae bacterium]|nr:hypothetical protein [Thermomicrobiaceae bacterium]
MADTVTHHHHHHHHYHHHYHQQAGQQLPAAYRGPRPQQHFQSSVPYDGAGLDYWGNFGAGWGYATGSGTGYYGGRRFDSSGQPHGNPFQQAFNAHDANTGYPFQGGYGQGYGNYGGHYGSRGYAGFGYNY